MRFPFMITEIVNEALRDMLVKHKKKGDKK